MMERELLKSPMFIGLYMVVLSMIFSPHLVFAQTDGQSRPTILPDNILYGLKIAIENIQEALTTQDEKRAELMLKHAEERDREAVELESQGKSIPLEKLKEIQGQKLMRAEEIIQRLEARQNTDDKEQKGLELRQELQKASNDIERSKIMTEQKELERSDEAKVIEPDLSKKPKLIESSMQFRSEKPITITAVEDIKDSDDQNTVLEKLKIRLDNSFSGSEITEIRAKFSELRQEDDLLKKKMLAQQLDEKINNPMVSISCFGRVNTFSIAQAPDPVKELQEQCLILKAVQTDQLRKMADSYQ